VDFKKYVSHEFHGKNHTKRWKGYTANFQIYRLDPGNLVTSLSYKNLEWVNDVVNPNGHSDLMLRLKKD
jgi:hypothetical protein